MATDKQQTKGLFVAPEEKHSEQACDEYRGKISLSVRGIRAQRGMTRKDLSRHSGISERYLAQVEAGQANMSIALLWRLAEAMDVRINDLLSSSETHGIKLAPLRQFLEGLNLEQEKSAYEMLLRHFADPRGPTAGVALIGLRGAGKSSLGKRLADDVGIAFITLSDVIEQLGGMKLQEIFSLLGQRSYRRLERQAVDYVLENHENVVLEIGGSLVSAKETFSHVLSSFYTVWIKATPEEHMDRVLGQGDMRPFRESDKALDDLKLILSEREPWYKAANAVIDTSGKTVEESADELIARCRCYCCQWQWGQ